MVQRKFWLTTIQQSWKQRSVIWLAGVRRVGKTFLCRSIQDIEYFDCELPRTRRMMEDVEGFLENLRKKTIAIDEIHRLNNPSELLKICSDYYPDIKVIATGSSTLGVSSKFKDTLTGRKVEIVLKPMISDDLEDFGNTDLRHRFLRGGLPPFFLQEHIPEQQFQEWMDAYWAKDIQELFRLERKYSFQKFFELLMTQSGGIFEATRFSTPCEVSRTTIANYLKVLEDTFVVNVIRPFSTYKSTEIVSATKVYAFDTGFITWFCGWNELRSEDLGVLWEHYVLNEIEAKLQTRKIHYWRDKRGHEVDFIILKRNNFPIAIECKWSANDFNPKNIQSFRLRYPDGLNYVVAKDIDRPYHTKHNGMGINFVSLNDLIQVLNSESV